MRSIAPFGIVMAAALSVVASVHSLGAVDPTPRETLLAAKQHAYDTNFRNDQVGMRAAIAEFEGLTSDTALGYLALYYAGWTEWVLSASEVVAQQPEKATASVESSVRHLQRALQLHPDDPEIHAALTWSLVAITSINRARWTELSTDIAAHRRRAVELAPENPRVVMLDAGMTFYAPPQFGGSQEKGIGRWLESIRLCEAEKVPDATLPDWCRTLAYGWGANLYLAMTPPRPVEAREMATKALAERPDFWYVTTQVVPKIHP